MSSNVTDYQLVATMREDNKDVFVMGPPADNVLFTIEEINEFWRAWQKELGTNYLRGNPVRDIDIALKKQLEWGQAYMMLLTLAIQANINPEFALHMAVETTYDRCAKKRKELDSKSG